MTDAGETVSESRLRRMQWGVLGAVGAVVLAVYAYASQSGPLESLSLNPADTYYNLQVRGFRVGQLNLKMEAPPELTQLADPYDPSANIRYRHAPNSMVDMSYYKGKLYLYFGVTPALILFWPYAAATGHYLFHRQAVAIFCAIGFLASAGLLTAIWRRYFQGIGVWVAAACVLALGLATTVPALVAQSDVYEVAISCGYMLTMLSLVALWRALHEPRHRMSGPAWLALGSVAYGLAVGARPSLVFGGVILLAPVIQARGERRPMTALAMAAVGPVMLIGLGLMVYNYGRFENPLEFGMRYQLGPVRQDAGGLFSLHYFWYNFRVYFLETARWTGRFPFVHEIELPPAPPGHHGHAGVIAFGVLTCIPLVWLVPILAGLAWRERSESVRSSLRWFLAAVTLLVAACVVTICFYMAVSMRYEVEILPCLVLLAAVGILGLERALTPRSDGTVSIRKDRWRRVVRAGWTVLLGFSVAFNLLVATANYVEARCYEASALLQAGKIRDAMTLCEQALRIIPDHAKANNDMGVALARAGRIQEAIGHYNQALRSKPGYAEAHNNLGGALLQFGMTREAMDQFNQALRINPDLSEAHNNLGTALLHEGNVPEAIGQFEQSLRIDPGSADAHYGLGVALEQLGRVPEAVRQYEEVLRIIPDDAQAQDKLNRLRPVR